MRLRLRLRSVVWIIMASSPYIRIRLSMQTTIFKDIERTLV